MSEISTKNIDKCKLQPNFFLVLVSGLANTFGANIFRVLTAVENVFESYDELCSSALAAADGQSGKFIGLSAENVDQVFWIDLPNVIYDLYIGIDPAEVKLYREYPLGTPLGKIDKLPRTRGKRWCFVNGNMSPYDAPTEKARMIVIPKLSIGFEAYNADNQSANPLLSFIVNRHIVEPVTDPELAYMILTRRTFATWVTLNEVGFTYDWGVNMNGSKQIPLSADMAMVKRILGAK